MLCENCKKELPDNASFCNYCGEKVEHKKSKENNEKSEFEKKVESVIKPEFENILNLLKKGYLLLIGVGLTTYSLFDFVYIFLDNFSVGKYTDHIQYGDFEQLEFTYEFSLSEYNLSIGQNITLITIGVVLIVLGILKLKEENKNN